MAAKIPAEAMNAAVAALSERTAQDDGTPGMDAARWHAMVALEAALPHLTRAAFYMEGVKAERERIAQLSQTYNAMYRQACMREDCRNAVHYVHFADLIRRQP